MSTKPILFNTEMVKAILEGRKTVTRRIIKPTSKDADRVGILIDDITKTTMGAINCNKDGSAISGIKPPYQIGDILYVRETWKRIPGASSKGGFAYKYKASEEGRYWDKVYGFKWKPSIHMPKEAARIWLKVINVRVERLQDITPKQAGEEGVTWETDNSGMYRRMRFKQLWDSTIKKQDLDKYGWDANPYTWVIEFERIENEN